MPNEDGKEVAAPEAQSDSEIVESVLNEVLEPEPEPEETATEETKPEDTEESATEETEETEEETSEEEPEEEDPENAEAVADLSDEQKARIQKRFGQITKARKEAESNLETVQGQVDAKDSDIADLEDRLETARKGGQNLPVAAALMAATSTKELTTAEDRLDEMIEWCEDHLDEGFVDEESGTETKPAEIRKKLRAFRKIESRVVPQAKESLKVRTAADAEARKIHPDLFNKNTESGQRYRRMLLDHPELKAVPNLAMLVGDALAGEKLRKAPPKKQPKKAPAAPENKPAPGKKEITDDPEKKKKKVDLGKVVESGGSRDSLAGAILDMDII